MARIRTRQKIFTGFYHATNFVYGTEQQGPVNMTLTDRSEDTVHPSPFTAQSPLVLRSASGRPWRISGRRVTSTYVNNFWNLPGNPGTPIYGYWAYPLQGWINEALSKIQDTAPAVDLPMEIGELAELPLTVLRSFGSKISGKKSLADVHLTTTFGVVPAIGVLNDLLGLQASLAERMRQHRRKYRRHRSTGGLSSSAIWTGPTVMTVSTTGFPFHGGYSTKAYNSTEHSAWYSARLTPQIPLSETLGLVADNPLNIGSADAATLWNLIPWSFLIDYFSDVSKFLEVNGNVMPYAVSSICTMCTSRITRELVAPNKPSAQYVSWDKTDGKFVFTEKMRWVTTNPTAAFAATPFLSGLQVANIAALLSKLR